MTVQPLSLFAKLGHDSGAAPLLSANEFGTQFGLLPREKIELMARLKMIQAEGEIESEQFQPASLDLRLGARAYRVRASFLPGNYSVGERFEALKSADDEINIDGNGAVLERGCVYVIPLLEHLKLPDSISAIANPKSSTGRLDIFTRLITDKSEVFDRVARGYEGRLYAEVSPRSFSVRVRKGSKLNQIRFRRLNSQQLGRTDFSIEKKELLEHHKRMPLVDHKKLELWGNGVVLRVGLSAEPVDGVIGYKAQKHADILDVDCVGHYDVADYWVLVRARGDKRLILDPDEFYILASRERLHIPPDLAADMVPIDPAMGAFRVHYAGFFDPGFGAGADNHPCARAVLEVRSHEVPFFLEDGQMVGCLIYEKMAEPPRVLYGASAASNYQGQGLKLSKHFRME
ncbi:MAG TPA: 2'-deoxycytidine 5'-triphosphate deaminase [Methylocella sp.]|nr:2'-deoxycytidine 5'-triphosphate deaminase [Methylocella sp.]